jgi:hypothetical protein
MTYISSLKPLAPLACYELLGWGNASFDQSVKDAYKAAGLKGGAFDKIGTD